MEHAGLITEKTLFSPLVTPKEMALWDEMSQKAGFPGIVLMEHAAHAAFKVLLQLVPAILKRPCAVLCGGGNNGGDAIAMGRFLHERGAPVTLFLTKDPDEYQGTCRQELSMAAACGVPVGRLEDLASFSPAFLLDGLLGTGFTGPLRGTMEELIRTVNALNDVYRIAIDIPSGLDGRSGFPCPDAVHANLTICMEALKTGLCMPHARPFTGKLVAVPIGIPGNIKRAHSPSAFLLKERLAAQTPPSPKNGHKGIYGHVGIIAGGTAATGGAGTLAARGALRAGAGLVHGIAPSAFARDIRSGLPEVMLCPLEGEDPSSWPATIPGSLLKLLPSLTSLVVGPGMGTGPSAARFLAELLRIDARPPLVLDADALTLLAGMKDCFAYIRDCDILTPHPGEAGRLLGIPAKAVQNDRQKAVSQLASCQNGVVLLKGASTLLTQKDAPLLVSPWDIPQLSVAGSGDVLSGILAALLAQRALFTGHQTPPIPESLYLAAIGVAKHAMAGRLLARRAPERGILAHEIADSLPALVKTRNEHKQQD
ncbi:MAG: NAD(P)H-hydrate dehydratase [Desulfovibrio sp.]|nr:NAD(P)H-hydrate dehydratase [Desulfovibrio sp.]